MPRTTLLCPLTVGSYDTDFDSINLEDYAVRTGSWKNTPISQCKITLIGEPTDQATKEIFQTLAARGIFRSDGFVDSEAAFTEVSDETVVKALQQLKRQYQ